jgi:hypothetical protein
MKLEDLKPGMKFWEFNNEKYVIINSIEWIDDNSINIIYNDPEGIQKSGTFHRDNEYRLNDLITESSEIEIESKRKEKIGEKWKQIAQKGPTAWTIDRSTITKLPNKVKLPIIIAAICIIGSFVSMMLMPFPTINPYYLDNNIAFDDDLNVSQKILLEGEHSYEIHLSSIVYGDSSCSVISNYAIETVGEIVHQKIISTSSDTSPSSSSYCVISTTKYESYLFNSAWFTMNISVIEFEGENLYFRFRIYQDPDWSVDSNIFNITIFIFMFGLLFSLLILWITYPFYSASKSIGNMTDNELLSYWENRPRKNKLLTILSVLLFIFGGIYVILFYTFPRFAKAKTARKELTKRDLI